MVASYKVVKASGDWLHKIQPKQGRQAVPMGHRYQKKI
jgi:hypothetical protein